MKVVACYSNKGGVGKTATAVNLAHGLAGAGKRVLLCDLDPQGAAGFYLRADPSKRLKYGALFGDAQRFADAIRGSDFANLDILPANLSFRGFDIVLAGMKNARSRLKKALKAGGRDYDIVVLDCPPSLSALSETVVHAADVVLVPVIPTTLSARSFAQLLAFLDDRDLAATPVLGVFSMVQIAKTMHGHSMTALRAAYPGQFLDATVPFAADVEKMGPHRAPVAAFAGSRPAARAYDALCREVLARL